jgi:ribosomal-protein-alanine N-acetyltransferase
LPRAPTTTDSGGVTVTVPPPTAPVLTDGVIRLRPHTGDDVDAMVEMCRDPEMVRWTSVPQPYGREHAEGFAHRIVPEGWARHDHRGWAIEALDDDGTARFAGNVDVRGRPVADVGFALHPWARGRGVMHRAIRLATRWCFDEGEVAVVHWRAHVGNTASRRAAWRAGFTFDGTTPALLHERGRLLDAWVGHLLPTDPDEPRTRWLVAPVLTGERAVLRPWRHSDVPRIVEACRDPRTRHWLPALPDPYTEAEARGYLHALDELASLGTQLGFAVADPVTDELLGSLGVMGIAEGGAEIGYWVHPSGRGRGVMSEAVRLAGEHAFRSVAEGGLGLHRLLVRASVGNAASRHVATAAGFRETGVERAVTRLGDGSWADDARYELLAPTAT